MKAVQISKNGGPEVLELKDIKLKEEIQQLHFQKDLMLS